MGVLGRALRGARYRDRMLEAIHEWMEVRLAA